MKILEDIQEEIKSQNEVLKGLVQVIGNLKNEVSEIKRVSPSQQSVPTKVTVNTDGVAELVVDAILSPLAELETSMKGIVRNLGEQQHTLRLEVAGVWGFNSWKSLFSVFGFCMLLTGFSVWHYLEYRESTTLMRLQKANNQASDLRELIQEWKLANPKDSQSFRISPSKINDF